MTDTLVQDVTKIIASYRDLVERNPTYTYANGKKVQFSFSDLTALEKTIEALKHADYYYLSEDFEEMIDEWCSQYFDIDVNDIRFTEFTRTPSEWTFIQRKIHALDDVKKVVPQYSEGFLCHRSKDGEITVATVGTHKIPQVVGSYHPTNGLYRTEHFEELTYIHQQSWLLMVLNVAACCEIINHPRFVTRSPAGTRQQRKHAKKAEGIAVEAWHRISWDINKPVQAKGDKGDAGCRMPLHYTRGYFRAAKEHWDDVVQWKDGTWKKWVEGYWAGHPAFGVKKGYHAPRIGETS